MRFLFFCYVLLHTSFTIGTSVTDDGPSEIDDKSIAANEMTKTVIKSKVNESKIHYNYNAPDTGEAKTGITPTVILDDTKTESPNILGKFRRKKDVIDVSVKVTEIDLEPNIFIKIYNYIAKAVMKFMNEARVKAVIKNIGTCFVNGALDIVSFYVPAPLIPLVASVAGMVIPFDPVVSLRQRLPVTSYRRAMSTAVKSFLGTFDRYKEQLIDYDEDPYMTRRFNRRLNNDVDTRRKNRRTMNADNDETTITQLKRKRNKSYDD